MASEPSGEDIQDGKAKECQRSATPPVPEGWVGVHERRMEDDPQVLETFMSEATKLVQGHVSRATYNMCLGLLAARLMLW